MRPWVDRDGRGRWFERSARPRRSVCSHRDRLVNERPPMRANGEIYLRSPCVRKMHLHGARSPVAPGRPHEERPRVSSVRLSRRRVFDGRGGRLSNPSAIGANEDKHSTFWTRVDDRVLRRRRSVGCREAWVGAERTIATERLAAVAAHPSANARRCGQMGGYTLPVGRIHTFFSDSRKFWSPRKKTKKLFSSESNSFFFSARGREAPPQKKAFPLNNVGTSWV